MPASGRRAIAAFASVALLVALALAGSAGGIQLPRKRDRVAPTAPANVRVSAATPTTVSLAWEPSADNVAVDRYYVKADSLRARVSRTEYTATNLACGDSIEVSIVALDRSMNHSRPATATVSTAACVDSRAPSAPLGFRQAATTQESVILEWNDSSDDTGVVAYGIYQNQVPVQSPSQPSTTLTGLACGETVEIQGDAVDAAGNRSARRSAWVQTAPCEAASASTQASPDAIAPSPPAQLSFGGVTETGLSLTWGPSADNIGIVAYDVYMNGANVASVTSTSFTQGGLVCDSMYWFGVEARDAAGNRSARARVNPMTTACTPGNDKTPPTKPANLAVRSVTQVSVALTWSRSTDDVGVTGYDAHRNGAKIVSVPSTSLTHRNLLCGTSYWLGIAARDASGNRSPRARVNATTSPCASSPPSPVAIPRPNPRDGPSRPVGSRPANPMGGPTNPVPIPRPSMDPSVTPPVPPPPPPPPPNDPGTDETPPTRPSNLAVASVTRTSVALTWSPSSDNVSVSGYRVYANGAGVVDSTQPGATVTALACGTAFTFEVDAADAAGNRSARARVTASTSPCADTQPPTTPRDVAASSRTATSIALTWTASSDNVGVRAYGLYRGGNSAGSSTTTTGIFSGLTCNTNYTLAVDAQDAAGNRSGKATVLVATTACPDTTAPSAPSNLAATNVAQTSLTLGWKASTDNVGVAGYDVFRDGTKMASVTGTSAGQTGLACGTSYWFGVEARDAVGNRSARVNLNATTSACPAPPPAPSPPPTGSCSRKWGESATATGFSELSGPTSVAPFTDIARQAPDRIQSVSSPRLGRHPFATRFEVRPGDDAGGSSGWRAELRDFSGRPDTPYVGTEYVNTDTYYSFAWYFPDDFEPQSASSYGHLMQFHSNLSGGPGPSLTISVKPGGGGLQSEIRAGVSTSPSKTVAPIAPTLNRGRWNELIVRYRRRSGLPGSRGEEGLVQIWHRLEGAPWSITPQVSYAGPNYMHDGQTDLRPQALQLGFYREATSSDLSVQRLFAILPWRCGDFASAAAFS